MKILNFNLFISVFVLLIMACNCNEASKLQKDKGTTDSAMDSQVQETDKEIHKEKAPASSRDFDLVLLVSKGTGNRMYLYNYGLLKKLYKDKYLKVYHDFCAFKKDVWTGTITLNFEDEGKQEKKYYCNSEPFNPELYRLYLQSRLIGMINKFGGMREGNYYLYNTPFKNININIAYYFIKNGFSFRQTEWNMIFCQEKPTAEELMNN